MKILQLSRGIYNGVRGLKLDQWTSIGNIVQSLAVVLGVGLAIWELYFNHVLYERERRQKTVDIFDEFMGELHIVNAKDRADAISKYITLIDACDEQETCDKMIAIPLFCPYMLPLHELWGPPVSARGIAPSKTFNILEIDIREAKAENFCQSYITEFRENILENAKDTARNLR
jgi:hypothetical protein